ncbi:MULTISPECIES: phosphatidate cytidylyltransferase [unclassified Sphingobacterium]|uniref:phosphatidate cytidylyltransferase n=1 Tax=unclassified Sphingobacterium TaxID=2609468 RepID=UPI0025FAC6AA|nr:MULTISPECIES: phosphatidate cytidylyltransferase [unclassified Sphingobacterium]
MNEVSNPNGKFADVPVRVRSWGYIVLVLAFAFVPQTTSLLFVSWLTFQGMREFMKMFVPKFNEALSFAVVVSLVQLFLLYSCSYGAYLSLAGLLCIGIGLFFGLIQRTAKVATIGMTFGAAACLLAFSQLAFIRAVEINNGALMGLELVAYIVVLTELNDVFQYLMGKFFGKRKIVPRISPNKTVAGCVGGIGLTVMLSNILGYLFLPFGDFICFSALGLLFGILGFCGDVLFSFLKRKTGVKDTGTLIPGHGGLLDRIDSLLFNAPVFYGVICLVSQNQHLMAQISYLKSH